MSENISITVKVGSEKVTKNFTVSETVEFLVEILAGESSTNTFSLTGMENPKFLAVFSEDYDVTVDPVEVRVDALDAYPIACSPVAVLTADVQGGFSDVGVGTAPIDLYFNNPAASAVTVRVMAGE